ncbi:hypothetical protein [Amycolatopsis sp. FDAARGOS 1241]|uniref:hypothetical protein n=1 Tax=Amycolatopsis sp. FDAARGOS 1241 TaxID=2778070 RepID=UPI0019504B1C|nr:hypothetical protein [Amycolatopsis sp. FDAARGOS 1241]QRP45811.1 hypothetical protein I6J71_43165 [Amycolatopsis sp. FDAARGOS 1241]
MLRTAERRATTPADDLLDRTGIIAASLPRGRRSPEDTQPIPAVPALIPVAGDGASAAVLAPVDTRPRAVVSRRRTRAWVAGLGALALLALGWLAGGLFSGSPLGESSDDVAAPSDQRDALVGPQQPAAPAPSPAPAPAPPAAPVTVYVPVPDHQSQVKSHETTLPTTPRSAATPHKSTSDDTDDVARADTKPASSGKSQATSEFDQYLAQWRTWIDLANRMSRR